MAIASHSRWNRLSIWVGGPLIVLIGVTIWIAASEFRASRRLQSELTKVKNELNNTPFRQHSKRLNDEENQQLEDFLVAVNAVGNSWATSIGRDLPIIGEAKISLELIPGTYWDAKPNVEVYLQRMAPAIKILRETPQPAQFPTFTSSAIFFDRHYYWNYRTLLGAIQVLQLDLEYALRTDDKSRALLDLVTIYRLVEAGANLEDSQRYAWSHAHRTAANAAVRRTLASGSMNRDEIQSLQHFVADPIAPDANWRSRTMAHAVFQIEMLNSEIDRAMLSDAPEYLNVVMTLPSLQEGLFNAANQVASIPVGDLQSMRSEAEEIAKELDSARDNAIFPISRAALQADLVAQLSSKLVTRCTLEEDRRFTLTAIAIKQFHLDNGKWPERLQDLSTVGLTSSDWQLLNGEQFGYQHGQNACYLWGQTEPNTPRRISDKKPAAFSEPYSVGYNSLLIAEIR